MRFLLLLISSLYLNATEFYAKLEPIESYNIKSAVSGKVDYANLDIEGKESKNSTIIKIDANTEEFELKKSLLKLDISKNILKIEKDNYNRIKRISSKSINEKNNQKIKVLNLESSILDMEIKIDKLKDTISKKTIKSKNMFIYEINVKEGDYVNPGTLLFKAEDISKAKLEIFIPISEVNKYKNSTIYIDDKKTDLEIAKIYDVADENHISAYKAIIYINNPEKLSKLTKIEFK